MPGGTGAHTIVGVELGAQLGIIICAGGAEGCKAATQHKDSRDRVTHAAWAVTRLVRAYQQDNYVETAKT